MRISVALCSKGRPAALGVALTALARQSLPPAEVILAVTEAGDLPPPGAFGLARGPRVVFSRPGLARQRNRALGARDARTEALVFFDDDYRPAPDALEGIARGFRTFPRAAGLNGALLADGVRAGGLTEAEAAAHLALYPGAPRLPRALARRLTGLYGCNMALRAAALGETRFDTRLPAYGWQEDVDFTARLPGEKLKTDAFAGVHLGQRAGRETGGEALGYAQIANPLYLMRKGALPPRFACGLMARNLLANHAGVLAPMLVPPLRRDAWADRAGRAAGNRRALADLMALRIAPERMLRGA